MEQQEQILTKKRLIDLSRIADRKGAITFSNYLNINEIDLFHQVLADIETGYRLSGGYEFAERQMIAFIPDALCYNEDAAEQEFPIVCLRFYPAHLKFADSSISHRDVLGALMHLGVERSRIGDIRIKDCNYYIYCEEGISEYLLASLDKVKHTTVKGERVSSSVCIEQSFQTVEGVVTSSRLYAIVAFALNKSRSQASALIHSQKVFVNACTKDSNACECKPGDIISVRGFGKFIFAGEHGETKKGRVKITIKKYMG